MQRRKKACNETCVECGKWAVERCAYCKRPICEDHSRIWPHPRPGEKSVLTSATRRIVTCPNCKCQTKLPDTARKAAIEAFREITDAP